MTTTIHCARATVRCQHISKLYVIIPFAFRRIELLQIYHLTVRRQRSRRRFTTLSSIRLTRYRADDTKIKYRTFSNNKYTVFETFSCLISKTVYAIPTVFVVDTETAFFSGGGGRRIFNENP